MVVYALMSILSIIDNFTRCGHIVPIPLIGDLFPEELHATKIVSKILWPCFNDRTKLQPMPFVATSGVRNPFIASDQSYDHSHMVRDANHSERILQKIRTMQVEFDVPSSATTLEVQRLFSHILEASKQVHAYPSENGSRGLLHGPLFSLSQKMPKWNIAVRIHQR